MKRKYLSICLIASIISIPFLYRPSRILYPPLFGIACPTSNLCVEKIEELAKAKKLMERNSQEITVKLGAIAYQPKFIFCSTLNCWQGFGFGNAAAITLGKTATIISPRGWKDYYIQHELIHHWQADKIGLIKMQFAPQWLIEGMAYSLSEDPRLLSKPFSSYREQFESWYLKIEPDDLSEIIQQEI